MLRTSDDVCFNKINFLTSQVETGDAYKHSAAMTVIGWNGTIISSA
jgi:hypothetical protein